MQLASSTIQRLSRLGRIGSVFCALAMGLAAAHAQGAAPLARAPAAVPLAQFFQHPKILQAKLSPSGQRLALSTASGGQRVALVVVELVGTMRAMRAAQFSDADVASFHWTSDERLVFSLTDLGAGSGEDRRAAPGLYAVQADGQDLRMLVQREGNRVVSSAGLRQTVLEWNHSLLMVPQAQEGVTPDEVVIGRMNFGADGLRSIDPLWLNVRSGRTRSIDLHGAPAGATGWLFDSRGTPRLAVSQVEGVQRIHWRDVSGAGWTLLAEAPVARGLPFLPQAVDDTGQLYVSQARGPRGESVLTRYDFERRAPEPDALVSTPGFDFRGSPVLDRAGARALGVHLETDAATSVWFDERLRRVQALADARFPGYVAQLSCRRCGAPDMVVMARIGSDRDPGSLWLYHAQTERWQPVGPVMEGIDPRQMARVDFQRIKARDGLDLPVWLTLPQGVEPGKPAPAVVLVHGGPWVRGGHWQWSAWEQFLASRGYLVISPEFRGSTGYGAAHHAAARKQWGQAMQDDVADALIWAQKQGLATDRACIAGASYGGYATLMGLVKHPELYRCGVAWVAVADLNLLVKGSWWVSDDTSSQTRRFLMPEWVGDPDTDAAMLTANSPVAQAQRIKAPLLLGMGEADIRVPLAHGERIRDAMKAAGHPPEWVTYPNEGHSWRQVSTQVDFAQRMERFLARHLLADPGASQHKAPQSAP